MEAFLPQIGRVYPRDGDVHRPQPQGKEPDPRVPRGPVVFAHERLVRVDCVQAPEHGRHGQVAEGTMELIDR